ncbi:MAG TPA: helix-turn-helix transcriptional regulator [Verrucomicrobiae bacterium]
MNEKKERPEAEIGMRLREFRESLRISRTAFALEIGVGSERLASYESGRAPIRYEVFSAISKRYFLNPVWLGIGQGPMSLSVPFEDAAFQSVLQPRMLFSQAVDAIIKSTGPPGLLILHHKIVELGRIIGDIISVLPKAGAPPAVLSAVDGVNSAFSNLLIATLDELQRNQSRRETVKKIVSKHPPKKS